MLLLFFHQAVDYCNLILIAFITYKLGLLSIMPAQSTLTFHVFIYVLPSLNNLSRRTYLKLLLCLNTQFH